MMLARRRPGRNPDPGHGPARNGTTADDPERARLFRDLAIPHFDDVYTLARYLLRNATDADDAVQECYLRAFRHFDSFQGPAIKPWLMAILRNVCHTEYARRKFLSTDDGDTEARDSVVPLWQEPQVSIETEILQRKDGDTIRQLLQALPDLFREVLVLREVNELSYRDIAEVVGAPVGTVMSRLARARAMLRDSWLAADKEERV